MMKTIHCKTLSSVVLVAFGIFSSGLGMSCASSRKTAEAKRYSERDRASLLIQAAMGSLKENDPISALEYLQRAEQIDPKFSAIYHARTQAFLARKDQKRAIEAIERARVLAPDDSGIANTAGKLMLDAGRLVDAEPLLKKAAEDPLFREAFKAKTSLGILYYRKNELAKSDEYLRRATEDEPAQSCIAYYYRGHIAMKNNRLSDAQRQYERASNKICSNFADAHYALGMILERGKNFDLARKKYLEVRTLFPESPLADQAMLRLRQLP